LIDSTIRKTLAHQIQAFDIGLIPGFAFAFVKNNWNLSILSGYGLVFQNKRYLDNQSFIKFLGFAPRFDIRVMGGYNKPNWFFMVHTDFDNKSIRFGDLVYRQHFYNIKIVAGKRFSVKSKNKKSDR